MSFFELDGGAKKAKKSTKTTKKAPVKKSSGKKTKKGGNFLGTVSELFAPAGWENFVTAAGLLALDRTDNYLRKNKDSKKQKGGEEVKMEEEMTGGARKKSSYRKHRGGADDMMSEEEMTGGARKRSSSRKQRGGSDGHHTVEALDAMMGGEEQEMTSQPDAMSQTGGAKSRSKSKSKSKGKVKKGHRGGAMTEEEKKSFLSTYHREPEEAKQLIQIYDNVSLNNTLVNTNQSTRGNKIISKVIETHSQSVASAPGNSMINSAETNINQSIQQQAIAQQTNSTNSTNSLFGGKKPKSKAKKPKTKRRK